MAQRILDNFDYRTRQPLDVRQVYADLLALKSASDKYTRVGLYNGLLAWVTSESKYYIFNNGVDKDIDLGYWREYTNTIPTIPEEDIGEIVK